MNTPLQDAIDRAAPAPGTRTQTNDQHRGGSAHGLGHAKQAAPSRVSVTKRDGSREPFDADRINRAVERATEGLDNAVGLTVQIASELAITLFDGITTEQLDQAAIQVAAQNVKDDPAFDRVAARLLLKTIYKRRPRWLRVAA